MSSDSVFNSFSTATPTFGTKEFLQSNSIIAKIAFLFFTIFIFFILLRLGISILSYFLTSNKNPHLINGMIDAKQSQIFYTDPSSNPYQNIPLSQNQNEGIEFTWSVWINITELKYQEGVYRHVFYKGNSDIEQNGLNFPNNAPGLYIAPHSNTLVVLMNTFNEINKEITIPDIPLNKWVNVIIRCQDNTLDVYINGVITRSIKLMGVPKQNNGNVYVASNGGFDGYISNLWYWSKSISIDEIQRIVDKGPNTNMVGTSSVLSGKDANYLSLNWYIKGV